jgi:hypothetical protein
MRVTLGRLEETQKPAEGLTGSPGWYSLVRMSSPILNNIDCHGSSMCGSHSQALILMATKTSGTQSPLCLPFLDEPLLHPVSRSQNFKVPVGDNSAVWLAAYMRS